MSGWLGLAMFAVAIVVMVTSGLPVYAVLLGTASVFAAAGVAGGFFEWQILGALPGRVVGLLEHDLLQALPLYALTGALLHRLPLAGRLQAAGEHLFSRSAAAPQLAAIGVGALLAPTNGSVGASLHTLARRVAPRLARARVPSAEAAATICVASTLGVVMPPSLVLLLLGDAMMRAHTEASNASHAMVRIVNTQDVFRAAFLPGIAVLVASMALAAWRGRHRQAFAAPAMRWAEAIEAVVVATAIVGLLVGVATGRLYAVEAAALAGLALVGRALATPSFGRAAWRAVLADAMTLTGLLMALLVAATTFSLVLRAFGSDALVASGLQALAPWPALMLAAVLGGFVLCSFVLDAFEMIFLVVPIVMPPLLVAMPDAAWVAALTLLVLQAGYLLPPLGYAVVMARRMLERPPSLPALARALAPQLLAQAFVIAAVVAWPQLVHRFDDAAVVKPVLSNSDVERLLQEAGRNQPRP